MGRPQRTKLHTLGQRMKAIREARGMSVKEVADIIGRSYVSVYELERDGVAEPRASDLLKFSRLTDCSLDWLFDESGPPPAALQQKK